MSLVITGEIAEAIISIAEKYGCTPEEYITMKILDDLDPKTRLKIYAGLFKKYHLEAKKLAEKGDIVQAGEKYWGAITALLNIVGELKNVSHYSHSDYWDIMEMIIAETQDDEIRRLFATAEKMHANYYHGFIRKENFPSYTKDAEKLIQKIIEYIGKINRDIAKELTRK